MSPRRKFSTAEDFEMCVLLYGRLRKCDGDALTPCGLKVWEGLLRRGCLKGHTAHSLASHMRRQILPNFRKIQASLPPHVAAKLLRKYRTYIPAAELNSFDDGTASRIAQAGSTRVPFVTVDRSKVSKPLPNGNEKSNPGDELASSLRSPPAYKICRPGLVDELKNLKKRMTSPKNKRLNCTVGGPKLQYDYQLRNRHALSRTISECTTRRSRLSSKKATSKSDYEVQYTSRKATVNRKGKAASTPDEDAPPSKGLRRTRRVLYNDSANDCVFLPDPQGLVLDKSVVDCGSTKETLKNPRPAITSTPIEVKKLCSDNQLTLNLSAVKEEPFEEKSTFDCLEKSTSTKEIDEASEIFEETLHSEGVFGLSVSHVTSIIAEKMPLFPKEPLFEAVEKVYVLDRMIKHYNIDPVLFVKLVKQCPDLVSLEKMAKLHQKD